MSGMDQVATATALPTTILSEDHEAVLRHLDLLEGAVAALAGGDEREAAWGDVEVVSAFLVRELERHLEQEEYALFPPIESMIGMTGGPTMVMRAEHGDMRRLNAQLASLVDRARVGGADAVALPELQAVTDDLSGVLRAHIYKEDNVLFPMADRLLPLRLRQQVAAEMLRLARRPVRGEQEGEPA